jgi:hypothetical protein
VAATGIPTPEIATAQTCKWGWPDACWQDAANAVAGSRNLKHKLSFPYSQDIPAAITIMVNLIIIVITDTIITTTSIIARITGIIITGIKR